MKLGMNETLGGGVPYSKKKNEGRILFAPAIAELVSGEREGPLCKVIIAQSDDIANDGDRPRSAFSVGHVRNIQHNIRLLIAGGVASSTPLVFGQSKSVVLR